MRKFLFLNPAQRFGDFALLLLRIFVGLFLVWGVWDNVTSPERMHEFQAFLAQHDFPAPGLMAPLSVYGPLASCVNTSRRPGGSHVAKLTGGNPQSRSPRSRE